MYRILEELWHGEINPSQNFLTIDPQCKELLDLIQRNEEKLMNLLNPNQLILFEKYLDCMEEYLSMSTLYAFQEGFCLASKLLIEALSP